MGYAGQRLANVVRLATALGALVVDVRLRPSSRVAGFGQAALRQALGDGYLWLGGFGNVNYRNGGPIRLADFDGAEAALRGRAENIILLCACRDVATCHRKVVAEKLAAEWGCDVVHLGRRGGGQKFLKFFC